MFFFEKRSAKGGGKKKVMQRKKKDERGVSIPFFQSEAGAFFGNYEGKLKKKNTRSFHKEPSRCLGTIRGVLGGGAMVFLG